MGSGRREGSGEGIKGEERGMRARCLSWAFVRHKKEKKRKARTQKQTLLLLLLCAILHLPIFLSRTISLLNGNYIKLGFFFLSVLEVKDLLPFFFVFLVKSNE